MTLADIEFSVQNVIDGQGISIALTGMAIVFVALTLITMFIATLPRLLEAASAFLPPEAERHAAPAAASAAGDRLDEEALAAIGFALHVQRQSREAAS